MTLAALIIVDGEIPVAPVLGLSWPEFRARRAVQAGARHLVLVIDRVTPEVVQTIDRLRAEGLSVTLARHNAEVADLFHPEETVLLMGGTMMVADRQLQAMFASAGPAVLCIDPAYATPGQELIDANSHWTGIARTDGAQVRTIAAASGDWDLGSALLRKLVASGASRIMVERDELALDLASAARSAQASRALVAALNTRASGWGDHWIIAPLTTGIAQIFPAALPGLARLGPWVAIMLFILAVPLATVMSPAAALAVVLLALLAAALARLAGAVTCIPVPGTKLIVHSRDIAMASISLVLATRGLPDFAALVLACALFALTALADRLLQIEPPETRWFADRAGQVVILLAALWFGPNGVLAGLAFCVLHALATLAFLQNRLSRVLTSRR